MSVFICLFIAISLLNQVSCTFLPINRIRYEKTVTLTINAEIKKGFNPADTHQKLNRLFDQGKAKSPLLGLLKGTSCTLTKGMYLES